MRESIELGKGKLDLTQYRVELGIRIDTVVKRYGKKRSAAFVAGVTVEQLNKWIYAKVKAPVEGLYALANGANVNFNWLVSGEGALDLYANEDNVSYPYFGNEARKSGEQRIDPDVLKSVLTSVIQIMKQEELQMTSPEKFSELVFALHDYIKTQAGDPTSANVDSMANIIRLATRQG